MRVKTEKILLVLLASRPAWGMFPVRIIFAVVLILTGLSRLTISNDPVSSEVLFQLSSQVELVLLIAFGVIELIGGILSLFGLAQRLVALIMVVEISLAILLQNIVFDYNRDIQTQALLFGVASFMLFSGAGRFSLDRVLAKDLLKKHPNKKKELYLLAETPYAKWWE